jgi:hypothetical protein
MVFFAAQCNGSEFCFKSIEGADIDEFAGFNCVCNGDASQGCQNCGLSKWQASPVRTCTKP